MAIYDHGAGESWEPCSGGAMIQNEARIYTLVRSRLSNTYDSFLIVLVCVYLRAGSSLLVGQPRMGRWASSRHNRRLVNSACLSWPTLGNGFHLEPKSTQSHSNSLQLSKQAPYCQHRALGWTLAVSSCAM